VALFTLTSTPLNLPKLHSRSYYKTTSQARSLLRHYPRYHSPRTQPPPPAYQAIWNDWASGPNRRYTKLITEWWATNNTGMPKANWIALAAATPVVDNRGLSHLLRPDRFFFWYQRKALAQNMYTWYPFDPAPLYILGPEPVTLEPFPDYPRGAWVPGPAPNVVAIRAHARGTLEVDILDPPRACQISGAGWLQTQSGVLPGQQRFRTILTESFATSSHPTPALITIELLPAGNIPPHPPGLKAKLWLAFINATTQVPGLEYNALADFS